MKINYFIGLLVLAVVTICCTPEGGVQRSEISGYYYEVYKAGDGAKIKEGDYAFFHMDIFDDKGELLQSYRNQKQTPSVKIAPANDEVRKKNPIVDVLSHLSVGDSVAIIMPRDSIPNFPAGYEDVKELYYQIVVVDVMDEVGYKAKIEREKEEQLANLAALKERFPQVKSLAAQTIADYKSGKLEVLTDESGLKYYIHETGTGDAPQKDLMLTMQYYGALVETGKSFDNSFDRGRGYSFRVGQGSVIQGWDLAAPLLPIGTKASLFIPANLGYGANGFPPEIPGGAELYFYVEAEEMFY